MTLLFVDGFDHYATADGTKKWSVFGSGVTINASGGRRGGGALNFNASTRFVEKTLPGTYSTLIVGAAYDPNGSATTTDIFRFIDSATIHCGIALTPTNAISAWRGTNATVLGTSANAVVQSTGYSYIECKVTISDTVGTIDVRVNGVSVLSLSGLDTRNGANAYVTTFRVYGANANPSSVDDLYVCDTAGSANNDLLGDCRVDTLFPTSDGNYAAFTPSAGTDHYALVDDATPNTTDHNDGSAVNDRDSYGFGNLTALTSQTVYGVQVNAAILKDDAGSKSAATFARSVSTNTDGASAVLGTSQAYLSQVFEQDPNATAAWTESTVNAAEFGVKVTA